MTHEHRNIPKVEVKAVSNEASFNENSYNITWEYDNERNVSEVLDQKCLSNVNMTRNDLQSQIATENPRISSANDINLNTSLNKQLFSQELNSNNESVFVCKMSHYL